MTWIPNCCKKFGRRMSNALTDRVSCGCYVKARLMVQITLAEEIPCWYGLQ